MDDLNKNLESELTPQQYFNEIKERKHNITDDELVKVYDNCLELLNKYKITGQKKGMKKLMFHLECIEKEREIVKMGINTFIYRDDIEEYIDSVAKDTVKIIELENYERISFITSIISYLHLPYIFSITSNFFPQYGQ